MFDDETLLIAANRQSTTHETTNRISCLRSPKRARVSRPAVVAKSAEKRYKRDLRAISKLVALVALGARKLHAAARNKHRRAPTKPARGLPGSFQQSLVSRACVR